MNVLNVESKEFWLMEHVNTVLVILKLEILNAIKSVVKEKF